VKIDHSKFSSDPEKRKQQCQKIIGKDHTHLLEIKGGKLALKKDYWQGDDFTHIIEDYAPEGGLKINYIPNKFVFTVEGTGALPLKEIFTRAVEIFLEKTDEFEDQLKMVKIEKIIPKISMRS
jgi:hypothetical protein